MKSSDSRFVVVFHYMDGEVFRIEVHPDEMDDFMACVGRTEVYFNESTGAGVWVPIDRIRYFNVERVDGRGKRVRVGDSGLSVGETDSAGPGGDTPEQAESASDTVSLSRIQLGDGGTR